MKPPVAHERLDWLGCGRGPAPAMVVVTAHPDDETIGAGGRLSRLSEALFVCVTDGAPRDLTDARAAGFATREQYAAARREEFSAVLALAGIKHRAHHLDCVDQEASLKLGALARKLAQLLRDFRPEAILTHPYEGGHPDHDATALIVHLACRLLENNGGTAPLIVEMTSYHGASGSRETGRFLCPDAGEEYRVVLSEKERRLKARLFECYRTQQHVLQAFRIDIERFRVAPDYDFTEPPHPGRLFYENFNWGMTGARWRELARRCWQTAEIA
jgi:LmbE family N-acetylglucosaminyl deacetylase